MKNIIFLLALALVCSSVWAVNGDMGGTDPNGSEAYPYLIEDLADFDVFADPNYATTYWASGVHTKLMTNIDLSGRTYTTAVIAPDTIGTPYFGIFDGSDFTVSNLLINTSSNDYLGLFGQMGGIVINLGLENVDIWASGDFVGSLCGRAAWNSNIENCYSTGMVMSSGSYVGGLCGDNWGIIENSFSENSVDGGPFGVGGLAGSNGRVIMDCYASGSVTSNGSYIGGLCGHNTEAGTITNCYATGTVTGNSYVGGLLGSNFQGVISFCHAGGLISGGSNTGGLVGKNDSGGTLITSCFWDTETTGQAYSAGGKGLTTEQMKSLSIFQNAGWHNTNWVMIDGADIPRLAWEDTGHASIPPAGPVPLAGSGTEIDPFLIQTASDFALLSWHASILDKHFLLTADINLAGVQLYPIGDLGDFTGIFDGGGYSISNVAIDLPNNNYVGIFSRIYSGGEIKDVHLKNVNIMGRFTVGSLVGYIYDGILNSCSSTGNVSGEEYVGGLVGDNYYSSISQCYSTASVSGMRIIGGLIGWHSRGPLSDSYATGTVSGNDTIGGLVGYNFYTGSSIRRCYAAGKVTGSTDVGGLCGDDYKGSIAYSYWDTETSGIGNSGSVNFGAIGKTTVQMQSQATFSNWDFDPDDGDPADWMMLRELEDYPRLAGQEIYTGDIAGLYGVDLIDFTYLSQYWGLDDCNGLDDCGRADIDESGSIDIGDLVAVANDWLQGI